ncbi:hypothetical protein QJS10_CPA08g00032 [Acorus calamus]|uniref:Uncharacterized protein n=1 Tax=Acorus calamus TaxID=4465 RepID=A0AAV9E9V6_ACOCL|nr:hypothetical protein QJS10_CPA08g00032 [Acorus calamus]
MAFLSLGSNAHDRQSLSSSFLPSTNSPMNVFMGREMQEVDMFLSVQNDKFKSFLHRLGGQYMQSMMNNFESGVACVLKKKDEEIANANTTVTTLKNQVFKLKTENFLWKKVAKDTGADVRTLNGELERVKREFAAAGDTGSECCGSSDPEMLIPCRICGSRDSCLIFVGGGGEKAVVEGGDRGEERSAHISLWHTLVLSPK